MASDADIAVGQRKAAKDSAARAASAKTDPRQSSGGGGFEQGTGGMPTGQPAERPGLGGMGFTDAEIRQMHKAAGNPRSSKTVYGPGEEY